MRRGQRHQKSDKKILSLFYVKFAKFDYNVAKATIKRADSELSFLINVNMNYSSLCSHDSNAVAL